METNVKTSVESGSNGKNKNGSDDYFIDVKKIRENARRHLEDGAVTDTYTANREAVLKLLNEALATEIVCVLRYKRHQFVASGIHGEAVAKEFAAHAAEEQGHADMLAERIVQLGGDPDFSPASLTTRSHSLYNDSTDLRSMIESNLIEERVAIDSYREMIRYLGDRDPTTRRMLEEILAVEEEHAKDMVDLMGPKDAPPRKSDIGKA